MLETSEHIPNILVVLDAVPVKVPALLGLDVLDSHLMLPDIVP